MKKAFLVLMALVALTYGLCAQETRLDDAFNELGENVWAANQRKNHWISIEGALIGLGLRYERMLIPYLSLGVNFVWSTLSTPANAMLYGLDASFRWYPWGRGFFMGTGYGLVMGVYDYHVNDYYSKELHSVFVIGMDSTLEIGWKFDFGGPGGFFLEPGLTLQTSLTTSGPFVKWYFGYLGLGYAF